MATELYDPKKHGAAASARLTYRGGPLLKSSKLYGVFVDVGSGYSLANQMRAFMQWLPGSDVVSKLAEYNVGLGSYIGDATLKFGGSPPPPPPPPPPGGSCDDLLNAWLTCMFGFSVPKVHAKRPKKHASSLDLPHRTRPAASQIVTDGDIQKFLSNSISSGALPKNDAETLFCTFWPSGVVIQYDAQDASCQQFCGYHSNFQMADGSPVYYAVLPYPDCAGCTGGMAVVDALTSVVTHEVCEAITDPEPGSGWYDDANGEIGDICAWKTRVDAGFVVQLEWSNKSNACI